MAKVVVYRVQKSENGAILYFFTMHMDTLLSFKKNVALYINLFISI